MSNWITFWLLCNSFSRRNRHINAHAQKLLRGSMKQMWGFFSLGNVLLSIRNILPGEEFFHFSSHIPKVTVLLMLRQEVNNWNFSSLSAYAFHSYHFVLIINKTFENLCWKGRIWCQCAGYRFLRLPSKEHTLFSRWFIF